MNDPITAGVREFMACNRQRVCDFRDGDWAERIERPGPVEGLRMAHELRQQAIIENLDWPDVRSRREDLESPRIYAEVGAIFP